MTSFPILTSGTDESRRLIRLFGRRHDFSRQANSEVLAQLWNKKWNITQGFERLLCQKTIALDWSMPRICCIEQVILDQEGYDYPM
ncbi:hypothetical protein CEXT_206691 [Caerostris extrusa]|uniref:Uncharacterized protein n=1 Tax=Caerostris extrusa TaxID=172846 RepID=A0AAV4NPM9_CAEEX|nr:hypothetical protein CEXT_206691 [Caerostris extrusa]